MFTNATPEYVLFCNERGSISFISDISTMEILKGNKTIKNSTDLKGCYVKVFYRVSYGRVSNYVIPL